MSEPLKTVAVLVANPALSSILSMTLAGAPALRVRPFETEIALRSYLQLVPADLVVTDFDGLPARLRADTEIPGRLQIIALASDVQAASGIDEVIMKPMSPRYLVERVLARLAHTKAAPRRGPTRRDWSTFGDNVVPLFSRSPEARL